MMLYGRTYSREDIRRYFGDIGQFAGIRRVILAEGRAKGIDAFEIRTGSGLYFTVLNDRGMDIGMAEHKGRPIAFQSKSGIASPFFYSPMGDEWLRNFGGGLLTTCGLSNVGPSEQDGVRTHGLHGRISNTPGEAICSRTVWQGDDLLFEVEGAMKESVLYDENLLLHRKIQALAGEDSIRITDCITNQGFRQTPLMLLYHINLGHPLIADDSLFLAPVASTISRDTESKREIDRFHTFEEPAATAYPQVFFHKMAADRNDLVTLAVINKRMQYGIYLRYQLSSLPFFTEWKNMQCQDYVLALEPGNCRPIGQSSARREKELDHLEPGEVRTIELELGILPTQEAIRKFLPDLDYRFFEV